MPRATDRIPGLLLISVVLVCLALGWSPKADRFTWFMENVPALIGASVALAFLSRIHDRRMVALPH